MLVVLDPVYSSLKFKRERYQCASVQRAGSEGGGQENLKNCKSFPFDIFCHMISIGSKSDHCLALSL